MLIDLDFDDLEREMKSRFSKIKETAEILSRFFLANQSNTYSEYMNLLKDASTIHSRNCVNTEVLIKQVIVRFPGISSYSCLV